MTRRYLALAFFGLITAAAPAREPVPPLDPAAAYILVDVEKLDSPMMKGTKMPGTLTLARYDPVGGDVRGGASSPATALPANVSPRVTLDANPLAKTKAGRQYLVRVEPDSWVIEGANGTAYSLGSIGFTVRAGEVVDLGVITPAIDWVEGEGPKSFGSTVFGAALLGRTRPKELRPTRIAWRPRGAAEPAPAVLAGRTVTPVTFTPDHVFGNYLGGLVNRAGGRASRAGSTTGASVGL